MPDVTATLILSVCLLRLTPGLRIHSHFERKQSRNVDFSISGVPGQFIQSWIGGDMNPGRAAVLRETTKNIQREMRNWTHVVLGNDDINERAFPRLFPVMMRARDGYIKKFGYSEFAFKGNHPLKGMPKEGCSGIADLLRYEYLYMHGGVWLDIDMQLLRDITPLLTEAQKYKSENGDLLMVGHESSMYEDGGSNQIDDMNWTLPANLDGRSVRPMGYLSVGFLAVTPRHPALGRLVEDLVGLTAGDFANIPPNILTGLQRFGQHVDVDEGGVYVLPSHAFYPVSWDQFANSMEPVCEVSECSTKFPESYGAEHWDLGHSWWR